MEKIEFSLDLYKTGKYDVVTREGIPVEIKFTDGYNPYPIVGCVVDSKNGGWLGAWGITGNYYEDKDCEYDLFLVEKEQPETPITIKGRKLADYIKDEADNFRQVLKDEGIDFQPDDIYWENYARQFMALVEEKDTLRSIEQTEEINEALVWAMIGATDAVLIKEKDKFSYEIDMYESPTEKGVRQLTTISIEAPTPYAAAVELYKKLKGE